MKTMVTEYVPVGVKKSGSVLGKLFALLFMASFMGMVCSWFFLNGARDSEYMYTNGKEVEVYIFSYSSYAEIIDYEDGTSETVTRWRANFYYTDEESGKMFSGYTGPWTTERDARSQLGKKITVTIDVESGKVFVGPKAKIKKPYSSFKLYKISVALTVVFCVSFVIFCFGVYRTQIRKRICAKIGGANSGTFLDESYLITGEVVASFGLVWYDIKVRYRDENGREHSRWAHSIFSHKEAVFLREKRFIQIAPYNNTFGVVEQMPVTKMVNK